MYKKNCIEKIGMVFIRIESKSIQLSTNKIQNSQKFDQVFVAKFGFAQIK